MRAPYGAASRRSTCGSRIHHLGHQPIRRRAAMQRTDHLAVGVDAILGRDGAETCDIQMRVRRLQRIERPLDEVDRRDASADRAAPIFSCSPSPHARASGSTPSMCDHCVGLPSRQPGIDQTKPTRCPRRRTRR